MNAEKRAAAADAFFAAAAVGSSTARVHRVCIGKPAVISVDQPCRVIIEVGSASVLVTLICCFDLLCFSGSSSVFVTFICVFFTRRSQTSRPICDSALYTIQLSQQDHRLLYGRDDYTASVGLQILSTTSPTLSISGGGLHQVGVMFIVALYTILYCSLLSIVTCLCFLLVESLTSCFLLLPNAHLSFLPFFVFY
jgi:hypothetical protein